MKFEDSEQSLNESANQVAELLEKLNWRIVFAESCTAGLIAATLSRIPGISNNLCGSFVTYRNDSKFQWLDVRADDLNSPLIGPVSETVARQMALGALLKTPEATIAVSITGHLGPNAPKELDGIAYSSIQIRSEMTADNDCIGVHQIQLENSQLSAELEQSSLRSRRQKQAVMIVLRKLLDFLKSVEIQNS